MMRGAIVRTMTVTKRQSATRDGQGVNRLGAPAKRGVKGAVAMDTGGADVDSEGIDISTGGTKVGKIAGESEMRTIRTVSFSSPGSWATFAVAVTGKLVKVALTFLFVNLTTFSPFPNCYLLTDH